jgi:mRNA interferase YafQ
MLSLFRTKTFLKEYKKIKFTDKLYSKYLTCVVSLLKSEKLSQEAMDHQLKGNYQNFREFHISGDLLIIYTVEDNVLKLIRIGTHSQLFE